jgi:aspartyl/glutamyl-tRNA(Asn/Gln) amidotransferase C subunit
MMVPMSITLDEVRHVARLARLELDEAELMAFQGELNALLGHFEDIQSVDVAGLDPKPHAVSMRNVWAQDIPGPALQRDDALRNAPSSKAGLFIVPTIIEE